jgi:organic radical activating enzyme
MYSVSEIFCSIQGEGRWSGHPAVFLRLSGCNLWDGREIHRESCASSRGAICPRFCDTDFTRAQRFTLEDLMIEINRMVKVRPGIVVVTGGEPLLQLDEPLLDALKGRFKRVHIETNGMVEPLFPVERLAEVWLCVSPKVTPDRVPLLRYADEVKVLYPSVLSPLLFRTDRPGVEYYLQPIDPAGRKDRNISETLAFVMEHPDWAVSFQTHKFVGLQ